MVIRKTHYVFLSMALLALLGGCVATPVPEKIEDDTRLDELVSNMDQSLANQASANALLMEQQQKLELQQQQLESLNKGLGAALAAPVVSQCPKAAACPKVPETTSKMVVGGLEQVWLPDLEMALTARIDTGAETSSLDARNIELFERDGKRWVRFEILNPQSGESVRLELRLKRTVGIVQSGATKAMRRPVVRMGIVIGNNDQTAEFTLIDRSHLDYQVLIGRSILKDVMVVDVSRKNVAPYVVSEKSSGSAGAGK